MDIHGEHRCWIGALILESYSLSQSSSSRTTASKKHRLQGGPTQGQALGPAPLNPSESCCPLPSAALLSLLQGTVSGPGFNWLTILFSSNHLKR